MYTSFALIGARRRNTGRTSDDRLTSNRFRQERNGQRQAKSPRCRAGADRPRLRQGLGDAAWFARGDRDRDHLDGLARARHRARHRRPAARPGGRGLRAGKLGQDHAGAARGRRGAEGRRRRRLHRRRACARPDLRAQARGRRRQPHRLAARYRRAGARNHRHFGALQRGSTSWSSIRSPLWCRAPRSRARWATAMSACRRG